MKLAAFVRARDLTCRAPGCDRPATQCDLDHTIAFADGGATHAANLKCLCRLHHLLATFCGWRAQQLPDGTVIWTLPGNQTYVTTPGSALLFPALCTPTGDPPAPEPARADRRGQRTAIPRGGRRVSHTWPTARFAARRGCQPCGDPGGDPRSDHHRGTAVPERQSIALRYGGRPLERVAVAR